MFLLAALWLLWHEHGGFLDAFSYGTFSAPTVVIDPGHGGEDGGAVSPEGIEESGINLSVSLRVRDIMRLCGQKTVMTREEDVSTGDSTLPTVKQRKASDIRARVALVNSIPGAVLISIHQNSLPSSPVTHGAQAFWNHDGETLTKLIQSALNEQINAGNPKQPREMDSGVYLMRNANVPGVLVECGFLSNFAETMQLLEPSRQKELALSITAGYLRYLSGEQP